MNCYIVSAFSQEKYIQQQDTLVMYIEPFSVQKTKAKTETCLN